VHWLAPWCLRIAHQNTRSENQDVCFCAPQLRQVISHSNQYPR
jgi:hypothetical protein